MGLQCLVLTQGIGEKYNHVGCFFSCTTCLLPKLERSLSSRLLELMLDAVLELMSENEDLVADLNYGILGLVGAGGSVYCGPLLVGI